MVPVPLFNKIILVDYKIMSHPTLEEVWVYL